MHPTIDPAAPRKVLARGLAASPGAATGVLVFDPDEAERRSRGGDDVILARIETSPEDIHGMHAACGILTARGGMTSHAAVVARGMGRPCVSGASDVRIDYDAGTLTAGGRTVFAGDVITIDGTTGEIMVGRAPMVEPELGEEFAILMAWVDKYRILKVRANAETPEDARIARQFGAEGIGFDEIGRHLAQRMMKIGRPHLHLTIQLAVSWWIGQGIVLIRHPNSIDIKPVIQ